jgi:hypothetical protein
LEEAGSEGLTPAELAALSDELSHDHAKKILPRMVKAGEAERGTRRGSYVIRA